MKLLSESFTARIKEQVKDQLPHILPQKCLTSARTCERKLFHETRDEVTLAKASYQPQSTYEAASTLTEFELKKILLDKMKKSESYLTAPEHRECYDVAHSDMPQDQEGYLGDNDNEPRKEDASRHDWFKKPTPP
ncbi:hypothetical protein Tco_0992195 [Tanacetum coccineum]|uniref:Uncharacterized protein n=1 Tax=Tanacetum coccineum TaxID=301880 RepID=A0ABQ5F1D0_9ASTR